MYRGIYYCGRLKAAGGLLGTEVAMRNIVGNLKRDERSWYNCTTTILLIYQTLYCNRLSGTLNHGSPLFIRESYIKSGCPLHISRIKISPILEIDLCPQT
jgi:hypothetical protein